MEAGRQPRRLAAAADIVARLRKTGRIDVRSTTRDTRRKPLGNCGAALATRVRTPNYEYLNPHRNSAELGNQSTARECTVNGLSASLEIVSARAEQKIIREISTNPSRQ